MKRAVTFLASILIVVSLAGQGTNRSRFVYNFAGGITVGGVYATQDWNETIDSIRVIAGALRIYSGGFNRSVSVADTATMLSKYALSSEISATVGIAASDTAAMLTPYVARGDTAAMLTPYVARGDTASMLSNYARNNEVRSIVNDSLDAMRTGAELGISIADSTGNAPGNYVTHKQLTDNIPTGLVEIADSTGNAAGNYTTRKALSDSIAANSLALGDSVPAHNLVYYLRDTIPAFVFGAGSGQAADSVLFAKGSYGFGMFRNVTDTLFAISLTNIRFSSGDSLKFNIYYGNGMTLTATDSLFTSVQSCGTYQTTLTPSATRANRGIHPGSDVWIQLKSDQVTAKRPKEWIIQLNKITYRKIVQ